MEHRCGYRRTATAQVVIRSSQGLSASAEVCNISASGALVRTALRVCVHAVVAVRFTGKEFRDRFDRQWVKAHVVRQTHDGLAMEWIEFSPEIVCQLLRTIAATDTVTVAIDAN